MDQTIATRQSWTARDEAMCETSLANPARPCSTLLHLLQPSARWQEGQQASQHPGQPQP